MASLLKTAFLTFASVGFAVVSACAEAQTVTVSGCVENGIEGAKVIRAKGTAYIINGAEPQPLIGTYGTVTGTPSSDGASIYMFGTVLDNATWVSEPNAPHPCPIMQGSNRPPMRDYKTDTPH